MYVCKNLNPQSFHTKTSKIWWLKPGKPGKIEARLDETPFRKRYPVGLKGDIILCQKCIREESLKARISYIIPVVTLQKGKCRKTFGNRHKGTWTRRLEIDLEKSASTKPI